MQPRFGMHPAYTEGVTEHPDPTRTGLPRFAGAKLVELLVAMVVFLVAFSGLFLVYGQAVRMLDSLRRISRADDMLQANVEFLRTRSWSQLTNVVNTSSGSVSASSSNLVESISATSTNSPVCNRLVLLPNDPLRIGLPGATRLLSMTNAITLTTTDESMRRISVLLVWTNGSGRAMSNAATLFVTKGGLSADYY